MPDYYIVAHQFLNITYLSISEMESKGNPTRSIIGNTGDSIENEKIYIENTKWSDSRIGLPILFNFYHGIEILMKAILQDVEIKLEKKDHSLTILLDKLSIIEDVEFIQLINIFKKHILSSPFKSFFEDNNVGINKFHEVLRYPESKKEILYTISPIFGKEKAGLKKFVELKTDIDKIRLNLIIWKKSRSGVK